MKPDWGNLHHARVADSLNVDIFVFDGEEHDIILSHAICLYFARERKPGEGRNAVCLIRTSEGTLELLAVDEGNHFVPLFHPDDSFVKEIKKKYEAELHFDKEDLKEKLDHMIDKTFGGSGIPDLSFLPEHDPFKMKYGNPKK